MIITPVTSCRGFLLVIIMARQDIYVDAIRGEVVTIDNLTNKIFYEFRILENVEGVNNDSYCYGEITVPVTFEQKYKPNNGIRFYAPYYPYEKKLMLRFRLNHPDGHTEYMLNKMNNLIWFNVSVCDAKGCYHDAYYSKIYIINENGNFNLVLSDGYLTLYSADDTDFQFKAALKQNEVFLLKAFAGNLYQFPTTGVGLIEFLHGNFENTGLATKLKSEFDNDQMIINDAYMDSTTGELYLDVIEKNG